jgi:hypothetical protein
MVWAVLVVWGSEGLAPTPAPLPPGPLES